MVLKGASTGCKKVSLIVVVDCVYFTIFKYLKKRKFYNVKFLMWSLDVSLIADYW